jgi:DNA repair protein RadC
MNPLSTDKKKYGVGHRARLRERFLGNPHTLPDYELLELLLGYVHKRGDTKPLAKELLARFGNLVGVMEAREVELLGIPGVGPALVTYLSEIRQLTARYLQQKIIIVKKAVTLDDIGKMARSRLAGHSREEVWVALLDNGNRLLNFERVSMGSVENVLFSPRDIVALILRYDASGVVLVHNHPGGDTLPSIMDLEATRKLYEAVKGVNARLLDHLILADGNYYSLTRDHLLG